MDHARRLACLLLIAGCGNSGRGAIHDLAGAGGGDDLTMPSMGGDMAAAQMGCEGELQGCYTVYAHADHYLYLIDLMAKQLVGVGPFKAPMVKDNNGNLVEDTITDLAVAPDNSIFGISRQNLYSVSAADGHVTLIGPVTACGSYAVALTFTPDGSLYAADFMGAFCRIDTTAKPPTVTPVGPLGGNLAIAGDIVAVGDGTMYGTAYNLSDPANTGTQLDNILVKIDPATGRATPIGSTGYPKMFGVAFALGQVFGFTHDGSGHVVTIDPKSGVGTLYNSFTDPMTQKPISFAGAGVNAMVAPTIM
jgi:hypothetical protein